MGAVHEKESLGFAARHSIIINGSVVVDGPAAFRCFSNNAEFFPDLRKRFHRLPDVFFSMCRRNLYADARSAFRNDGEGEANHMHTFFEKSLGHIDCFFLIAEHDRRDRMLRVGDREAALAHDGIIW